MPSEVMEADASTDSIFDRAPLVEPSHLVGFAGNAIESRSEQRGEADLAAALARPDTRIMLVRGGRLYLSRRNGRLEAWHGRRAAEALGAEFEHAVLLGSDGGIAAVIAPARLAPEELPEAVEAVDFRTLHAQELVAADVLGALALGSALLSWHASHRFCGRCGHATEMRAGGFRRTCPSCGAQHFPRTDPVVIMLAVAGGRCLLGRGPHFAPGVFSCLAGFLEPGETIEAAVRRETFEEAGVRIGRVVYHASQPWPFPHTLMIGCFAEALTTELVIDRSELEDCRWFDRQQVRAALAGRSEELTFPTPGAIATHLIRAWAER